MGHREDLNYLIGEIQGELSNSHTYVGGGDLNDDTQAGGDRPPGCGLTASTRSPAATTSRRSIRATTPAPDFSSPLTEPGIDVHDGDYLLAVDGHELKAPTDPFSLFVGTRGQHRDADGGG